MGCCWIPAFHTCEFISYKNYNKIKEKYKERIKKRKKIKICVSKSIFEVHSPEYNMYMDTRMYGLIVNVEKIFFLLGRPPRSHYMIWIAWILFPSIQEQR